MKIEYKSLQDYVKENCKIENMDYVVIWRIFGLEAVRETDYSFIHKLAELFLTFAECQMPNLKKVLPICKEQKTIIGVSLARTYYPPE